MTRDQRACLAAILASPEDDNVRLLFADACVAWAKAKASEGVTK